MICCRRKTECTIIEAFDKELYVQIYGEIFEDINKEYNIYDSHNLKV